MTKKWFYWINVSFGGLTILFLLLMFWMQFTRPTTIEVVEEVPEAAQLPKGAFELDPEKYEAIGPPLLSLHFSPKTLQLPNLKTFLQYYGKNERPDADPELAVLNFAFRGEQDVAPIPAGKPLYLIYDPNASGVKYKFSPNNAETSLWIEATPKEKEATVGVAMKNEAGKIIREPAGNAEFTVKERQQPRYGGKEWSLDGKYRIDGTLLARQKARWYGPDTFLERHGGEEYKDFINKNRIDFGEEGEVYSAYVGLGDALAWIDGKWKEVTPGEESKKYPLIVVDKIEDRLIKFEFWDVDGKRKLSLNLIKSRETWRPQIIQKEFKFVGARTRSQFVFEIAGERILLSPEDWLLKTDQGWVKLTSAQDIDDYVERRVKGPLFVFDGVIRKEGRQVLVGTLFNPSRTEMQTIELPMQQGATAVIREKEEENEKVEQVTAPPVPEETREKIQESLREHGIDQSQLREVFPRGRGRGR